MQPFLYFRWLGEITFHFYHSVCLNPTHWTKVCMVFVDTQNVHSQNITN